MLLLGAAACAGNGGGGDTATTTLDDATTRMTERITTTSTMRPKIDTSAVNPCALITTDEASTAVGSVVSGEREDDATGPRCYWSNLEGELFLSLAVLYNDVRSFDRGHHAAGHVQVDGIGESAWLDDPGSFSSASLDIWIRGAQLHLSLARFPREEDDLDDRSADLRELASSAVATLIQAADESVAPASTSECTLGASLCSHQNEPTVSWTLNPDGLGLVSFTELADSALSTLTSRFGEPTRDFAVDYCPSGQISRQVDWD